MKKINRKDGLEYIRKSKAINYNFKTTIKLSKDQHLKALEKAEELGISFNELVRQGINFMLDKKGEN